MAISFTRALLAASLACVLLLSGLADARPGKGQGGGLGFGAGGRPLAGRNITNSTRPGNLGTRYAVLAARLNGSNVVDGTGDVNATGRVRLALFKLADGGYNVMYDAAVKLSSSADTPTTLTIHAGAADVSGDVILSFDSATWTNQTRGGGFGGSNSNLPAAAAIAQMLQRNRRPAFTPGVASFFAFRGTWTNTSSLVTAGGKSYSDVLDALVADPSAYYASVASAAFSAAAARGQFANATAVAARPAGGRLGDRFRGFGRKPRN